MASLTPSLPLTCSNPPPHPNPDPVPDSHQHTLTLTLITPTPTLTPGLDKTMYLASLRSFDLLAAFPDMNNNYHAFR